MDPHERFMKHRTTEVTDFLTRRSVNQDQVIELLRLFNRIVTESYKFCDTLQRLETLRTILCLFYQQEFEPNLHEALAVGVNKHLSSYPMDLINVDKIQKILCTQLSTEPFQYREEVSLVVDILILHMRLFCNETAIWGYLKELQNSIHSHLVEKNDLKSADVELMDCYMDSLLLHQISSQSTDQLKGREVSALFLKNVQMWLTSKNCKNCQLLTVHLPKLLRLGAGGEILTKIWEMIFDLRNDPDYTLFTLFLTADIWFPMESEYDQQLIDLAMEEPFWLLLLNGLSSLVTSQRKHAVHLLKRVADFADGYETLDLELNNYREITPLVNTGNNSQYHAFEKNCINFFMVLEDLEAKLQNSVTSVFPLFETLIDTFVPENLGSGSHIAWIRCACTRILQHDDNVIVKWGLLKVLTLSLELYNDEFLRVVLDVLNNISLYENHSNEEEPIVVRELIKLLNNAETKNRDLVTRFVVKASKIKWCPVALFYVTHALSMVKKGGTIWKAVELEAVKSLAEIVATVHCQILRIGSQIELLEVLTHFATELLNLVAVANTLSAFSSSEALIRGQLSWKRISAWLSKIVKEEEALSFLDRICAQFANENSQNDLSMRSFSLIIMFFHDGHLLFNSKLCPGLTAVRSLLHCLIGADSRPYANEELRRSSIEFISHLLGFITSKDNILCELIADYADVTLRLTFKHLRNTFNQAFINNIDTYVLITQQMFIAESSIIAKREVLNHIERFGVEAWNIIDDGEFTNNVHRLFGIKILHACLKATNAKHKNYRFIGPLYKTYKTLIIQSPEDAVEANETFNESRNLAGKIAAEYYKLVADLFHEYLKDELADEWISDMNWFEQISYLIQIGSEDILVPLIGIISQLFYKGAVTETKIDSFKEAMKQCWESMLKSKEYQLALEEMINLIFSSPFLEFRETRELTMECTNKMLEIADQIPELSIILVRGLKQAKEEYLPNFYNAVLASSLFGTEPSSEEIIELQACSYILDCYQEVYPNYLSNINPNIKATTRAHAFMLLHKMITDDPTHSVKLLPLIVAKLDEAENKHQLINRITQVLLVLQPVLEEDDMESLHSLMCNNILSKSSQPGVRIMQEWLLIRIYLESDTLRDRIWDLFDQGQENRVGSLCSVLSVVYHVARSLSAELQPNFINLSFHYIMPCCMEQEQDVCIYARVVACKLYDLATELCYSTIMEEYKKFYIAVTKSLKHGDLMEDSIALQGDFYFRVFNPIDDYSLQTIFYELPRLSNVPFHEYISPQMFEKFGFKESNSHPLKLLNLNNRMNEAQVSVYILKSSGSARPISDDANSNIGGSSKNITVASVRQ